MGINKLGDKSKEKEHRKLKQKRNKNKLLNNGNVVVEEKSIPATTEKKKRKLSQKKDADIATPDENSIERKEEKKRRKTSKKKKVIGAEVDGIDRFAAVGEDDTQKPKHKGERAGKKKKKDHTSLVKEDIRSVASEVYCISSVDVDSTKGMKKWINEYYQQRPGLKILQQRIDDFMTSHEEKEEQARKEREALAAEGGWTVVEHHKGRKKTIEAESGTAVVSVAGAAVMDKMGKKKNKEVGVDFYRFQKREAQRNEIMMLQSKFEQDKKRIQQLRAARKFRPY